MYSCITRMYSCVTRMYLCVTRMYLCVARMYSYVVVCHSYVVVWCFSHDHQAGPQIRKIFRLFQDPGNDDDFDKAMQLLSEHFEPQNYTKSTNFGKHNKATRKREVNTTRAYEHCQKTVNFQMWSSKLWYKLLSEQSQVACVNKPCETPSMS